MATSAPNSRKTLTEYCLRRLGAPVLQINVAQDQIDDCINDSIQLFQEFHSDATKRLYISYQITSTDVTNKYIPIGSDIISVIRMLPLDQSSLGAGHGMFSVKYQLHMNDIANMNSFMGDMAYYSQITQYLELLDMVLSGTPQISFSRHEDRLYIFGEFFELDLKAGDWIVLEVQQLVDTTTNTSIYNDIFIKSYTTALIKQRWGQNMSKFEGMQLPGGVTISGERILSEATAEVERLEEKMRSEYETFPEFYIG